MGRLPDIPFVEARRPDAGPRILLREFRKFCQSKNGHEDPAVAETIKAAVRADGVASTNTNVTIDAPVPGKRSPIRPICDKSRGVV